MFLDIALAYDPARRRCDFVYEGGRLRIDHTPATPLLIAIGSEARAEPDDVLPDTTTESSVAATGAFNPRRGYAGDALNGGVRTGSRLWLYEREKQTDEVLLLIEDAALEAVSKIGTRHGVDVAVAASYPARDVVQLLVQVGAEQVTMRLPSV